MTEQLKTVLDVAAALGCAELPAVDTADGVKRVADKEKNTTFLLLLARELGLIDGPADTEKNRIHDVYFLMDLARGLDLIGGVNADHERSNGVKFLHEIAEYMGLTSNALYTHLGPEVSQEHYKQYDINLLLDLADELGLTDGNYRFISAPALDVAGKSRVIKQGGDIIAVVPDTPDRLKIVSDFSRALSDFLDQKYNFECEENQVVNNEY